MLKFAFLGVYTYTPYHRIPNSTPSPLQGSSPPFLRSFTNAFPPSLACLSPRRQRGQRSVLSDSIQSLPTHSSDVRKSGNSKGRAEVGEANGQDTKGIELAAEPEEVKVPYACPHPVQPTTLQGSANGELVAVSAETLPPSMASWLTSTT